MQIPLAKCKRGLYCQADEDVASNCLGGTAARTEAEAADLGEMGEGGVSEWGGCIDWLQELSWEVVRGLLGVQTLRPSGRYTGSFQDINKVRLKRADRFLQGD